MSVIVGMVVAVGVRVGVVMIVADVLCAAVLVDVMSLVVVEVRERVVGVAVRGGWIVLVCDSGTVADSEIVGCDVAVGVGC